jgi:hypothetical protein
MTVLILLVTSAFILAAIGMLGAALSGRQRQKLRGH